MKQVETLVMRIDVYKECNAPAPMWPKFGCVLFRFAFTYLLIYAFGSGNGTLWDLIPFGIGGWLSGHVAMLWFKPAELVAKSIFHLTGVAAHFHDTGSGDTAINWIAVGLMLLTALFVAIVWSIFDRNRREYRTLAAWLRFLLRLTLVFTLLGYGLNKVFPLQMPPPTLAVLNEPLGQSSPMTLLWTMLGLNPFYESVCGIAEMSAGILLLFRRTALAGGLLAGFVLCNVLLYNLFFDVPVKLYAAHLVLFSIAVVVPDTRALLDFFWRHKPATPSGVWVPPASRHSFRIATLAVECCLLALFVWFHIPPMFSAMIGHRNNILHPSAFTGEWRIETSGLGDDKVNDKLGLLTGEGQPATEVFLEPNGNAMIRSADGQLWRTAFSIDPHKHTVAVSAYAFEGGDYTFVQPDDSHLVLEPSGKDSAKRAALHLARVPLPKSYPLLTRGFHLVSEWGVER
jgi:hypothetical protein